MISKYRRSSLALVAAMAVAGASTQARAQNILNNGDFQATNVFGTVNGFGVVGCETSAPFGGVFRSPILGVSSGGAVAFTSRNCESSISQTLSTVVGQQYSVSFFARVNTNVASNGLRINFGGTELFNQMLNSNSFQQFTVLATATSTSTSFVVSGRNADNSNIVDNISISAVGPVSTVPEPATVALMGTGLLGLMGGGYLRRRKTA